MNIYFDNAATTPLYPEVLAQMTEVLQHTYGNPSSTHAFGRSAKVLIEGARKRISKWLNAQPSELIFTSGGTEANNLILRGCIRDLGVQVVITTAIEHHAVLHTLEALAKEYPIQIVYLPLTDKGEIQLSDLEAALAQHAAQKVLVSLMHLNNEIGNILPIERVAMLCKAYKAYFHSDTVQSVGHYPIDLQQIPVDFITASAHKFHGPKGVGFAFIRKGITLHPLIYGGAQEKGLRAGTESLHNIVGMAAALTQSCEKMEETTHKVRQLKQYLIGEIQQHFAEAVFNGCSAEGEEKASSLIVNVGFPSLKEKNDTLLFELDLKGVACSKGSACQSGSVQTSHVLSAFLPKEQLQYPSLRLSLSHFNTKEEIDIFIKILREIGGR